MAEIPESFAQARQDFDRLVGPMRPRLHRYCAGLTGSVIDGEDVVQEAFAKAYYALTTASVDNIEGWMFRIAHNAAMDHLRVKQRREAWIAEDDVEMLIDDVVATEDHDVASFALGTLMHLAPRQRSCVLLKDVMGYSISEIGDLIDASSAAVKASLHRGRQRLRQFAREDSETQRNTLPEPDRSLLTAYVDHFNARNFDAIRAMLAEEVRLDIAGGKGGGQGRSEVGGYFGRYAAVDDWHFVPGIVEGGPAAVAHDPNRPTDTPIYFVLLSWRGGLLTDIRDFRYARYASALVDYG